MQFIKMQNAIYGSLVTIQYHTLFSGFKTGAFNFMQLVVPMLPMLLEISISKLKSRILPNSKRNIVFGRWHFSPNIFNCFANMTFFDFWSIHLKAKLSSASMEKVMNFFNSPQFLHLHTNACLQIIFLLFAVNCSKTIKKTKHSYVATINL